MNIAELLQRTSALLEAGGEALGGIFSALADELSEGERLDTGRLERYQGPALRLAHLHAQHSAALSLLPTGDRSEAEGLIAAGFGAMTVAALAEQMPALAAQAGGAEAADGFARGGEVRELLGAATGADFYDRLWDLLDSDRDFWVERLESSHRLLRQSFRRFAEQRVKPIAEAIHRDDALVPDDLIAAVAELGAFGLSIPEAHGGFQERPDHVGMVLVTEELSRGALVVGSLATRPEILAKALLRAGTPEQQAKWLPAMAAGEKMVAIAVTEPDYGSDVAGIRVAARPDGGDWRISGTKTWSTFAGRAELIALLARSEPDPALGHRGLSLFVIEKPRFPGHEFTHESGGGRLTGRAIATSGYRGMHSFELHFEDYLVPGGHLVGGEAGRGRGFYLQMEGFGSGRLQTAGRAVGLMQAAYEAARDYARSRRVFGKPLAAYPLTREKLGRMAMVIEASRQACHAAARRMDEGEGQMEASLVKFFACRQAEWVTREAQQLHGGMGYAEEFPVSRYYVDARVLSIFEGAEEVLGLKVIVPALLRR